MKPSTDNLKDRLACYRQITISVNRQELGQDDLDSDLSLFRLRSRYFL
jgi:hypothetical protein